MRTLRSALTAILLAVLPAVHAAPALTSLLEANTAVVVSVQHLPELLKNWQTSPWMKTWNDPQVMKFFGPLREQMKIDQWDDEMRSATGYTLQEFLGLAKGQALLAVPGFDFLLAADPSTRIPPLLVAVEFGRDAPAVEKLMVERAGKAKGVQGTEEFQGATVHSYRSEAATREGAVYWTMTDGVLLAASTRELLQQTVVNLRRGGAETPLSGAVDFIGAGRRAPAAQLFLYVNCRAIYPVVAKMMDRLKAPGATAPNPLMPDPGALLHALGVDALGVFSFSADIGETATDTTLALTYSDERGLVKLLSRMTGEAPRPQFVPPKWPLVSTGRFSLKNAYATLEEALRNASPPLYGLLQAQLTAYNQQLGIDLKRDLLGSMGDEMISAYVLRPDDDGSAAGLDKMDQFFAFSLTNRQAFENSLEAIKGQFHLGPEALTKREYLGETIYSLPTPAAAPGAPAARGFSYAVTKQYLFISVGTAAPIESAIQGLGGNRPSFWDDATVQAAFAPLPPGASGLVYHDFSKLVAAAFSGLAGLTPAPAPAAAPADDAAGDGDNDAGTGADKAPGRMPRLVDPAALPAPEVTARYWGAGVGASYQESNAFVSRYHIAHPH